MLDYLSIRVQAHLTHCWFYNYPHFYNLDFLANPIEGSIEYTHKQGMYAVEGNRVQ